MTQATDPVAVTIAGDLIVYFVCPLMVALILSVFAYIGKFQRRLNTTESALALLVNEVNPPGRPSLRDMLGDVRMKQGEMAAAAAAVKEQLDRDNEMRNPR